MANAANPERLVIRPQYHFRKVGQDIHIWDVRALLKSAKLLPIIDMPLADIREIDEPYWFDHGGPAPTCRAILGHVVQAMDTDLSYPILLCSDGRIMDGMHRVLKALHQGHSHIKARKLLHTPPPDHVNTSPADLPYE